MTVLAEGGARRPAVHPELAAWRVVRASLHGQDGVVVGPCPACGQPLVADGPAERAPWTVRVPTGDVVIGADGQIAGLSLAQADERVVAAYPTGFVLADVKPGVALFQGSLLTLMLFPLLVWVAAAFIVVLFLANFGSPIPTIVP